MQWEKEATGTTEVQDLNHTLTMYLMIGIAEDWGEAKLES
jgi:hypothetical protein